MSLGRGRGIGKVDEASRMVPVDCVCVWVLCVGYVCMPTLKPRLASRIV
jgi:hypothetical protein